MDTKESKISRKQLYSIVFENPQNKKDGEFKKQNAKEFAVRKLANWIRHSCNEVYDYPRLNEYLPDNYTADSEEYHSARIEQSEKEALRIIRELMANKEVETVVDYDCEKILARCVKWTPSIDDEEEYERMALEYVGPTPCECDGSWSLVDDSTDELIQGGFNNESEAYEYIESKKYRQYCYDVHPTTIEEEFCDIEVACTRALDYNDAIRCRAYYRAEYNDFASCGEF